MRKRADVLIQAGHEGRVTGATGAESQWGSESEWNPIVADEATLILRNAGIEVIREDAYLDPDKYNVSLAIFIHFDSAGIPCNSGASIGYDDTTDKPAADQWRRLYSQYWPFRWMSDNFTDNLSSYYGYRYTITSDAELVLELGELTCKEQALWLKPRLKWLGSLIAHFVSLRLGKGNIPDPGEFKEQRGKSDFNIDLRFLGGLTDSQKAIFEQAAKRWQEIIIGDLPSVRVDNEIIDDIVIEARGVEIDGRGNILGQAGPTLLRPRTFLPARGIMSFDSWDIRQMEEDGILLSVIIHEMCHVLGFGTIWKELGLLQDAGTFNPIFTGVNSGKEYAKLRGTNVSAPVPVANTGGAGTRDSHWRESVFGNELMTGFINPGINPISRITVASMQDIGYQINYDSAETFILPTSLRLAELGVASRKEDHGGYGIMFFPDREVLPDDVFV